MKKFIFLLFVVFLFQVSAFAETEKITLECSYITAKTDLYLKLNPITLNQDGNVFSKGKLIGKVVNANSDEILAVVYPNSLFFFDKNNWMSIYTMLQENEKINNFGSCQLMD